MLKNKNLKMIFNGRMMMESKREMIENSVAFASGLHRSQNDLVLVAKLFAVHCSLHSVQCIALGLL